MYVLNKINVMHKTIIIVSLLLFVGYMTKLITNGVIFKRYKKPFVITNKFMDSKEKCRYCYIDANGDTYQFEAKGIKDLYKSKESAKQVLRIHLPHLEATEATIEDIWQKGVGLEKIRETGLHKSLAESFNAILSLCIDLKDLGK